MNIVLRLLDSLGMNLKEREKVGSVKHLRSMMDKVADRTPLYKEDML